MASLIAEFRTADELLHAAKAAKQAGYRKMDAYTPYPVEGLSEALRLRPTYLPLAVLLGGILGGGGIYALEYWINVVHYPLNIGGRPPHSWPLFIPVTFECAVLVASLVGVLAMLLRNGLPRLHHPVFDVPGFDRASQDRFFLMIDARDAQFDAESTKNFLKHFEPIALHEVHDA